MANAFIFKKERKYIHNYTVHIYIYYFSKIKLIDKHPGCQYFSLLSMRK